MFCPILHSHSLLPFCLTLCKIQITGYELPHGTKFFFIQIVFGNRSFFQCRLLSGKSGQPHEVLFRICPCIDNLRCGLSMNGIVNLVLHFFEN